MLKRKPQRNAIRILLFLVDAMIPQITPTVNEHPKKVIMIKIKDFTKLVW